MRKTGAEIENDVYNAIAASSIKTLISGSIYKAGLRPINSVKEDAIVSFMTGLDGQIQKGVVNVNIYVPNLNSNTGIAVKNTARCTVIEKALAAFVVSNHVGIEYLFELGAMIQTFEAPEIKQHFINCKIKFSRITI